MLVKNKDGWYFQIKTDNEYVKGILGHDLKLSFRDRLTILFSKGISVVLIGSDVYRKE